VGGNAGRAMRRAARSAQSVDVTRGRFDRWFIDHRNCAAFARFANHFNVLDQVLNSLLDAIAEQLEAMTAELDGLGEDPDSGPVYERCAHLDRSLAIVVRLFEWYATRYDQRLDKAIAPALLAADEIVRSCWFEPFALLGRTPPTAPLVYLETDFDAFATPRISIPRDLQGPADSPIFDMLTELPIPVIALPALVASQAWWLVLAAHETGHHVQYDLLPGLAELTGERLVTAVAADDQTGNWAAWRYETFADAYSALMVGAAAAWAIDEIQHSTPARLCKLDPPGRGKYPARVVRTALLGECLRRLDAHPRWPTVADARTWLGKLDDAVVPAATRETIQSQLNAVPAAAAALVDLPVGPYRLGELGAVEPAVLTQPQLLRAWAAQLTKPAPLLDALDSPSAARLVIAAGVAAYRTWVGRPEAEQVLPVVHSNLLDVLPGCGPPGFLAAPPRPADVTSLARRLAQRLLREAAGEDD
jgi:hypothetical protein